METSKKWLLAAIYALAFGFGLTCTMIAPLVSLVLEDFSITTAQGGLVMTFMNVGALLSVVLMLFFGDRVPRIAVYGVSYLLFSAALLCIVGAPSYAVLLALMLVAGLGSKTVDILANPILSDAFPVGGEKYINLLHMSLSAGGCLAPVLLQAMLNAGLTWRAAFAGIGAFCGLLLLCSAPTLLRSAKTLQPVRTGDKSAAPLYVTSIMILLGLCTLFNQCHQTLVNTWGTVYAQRSLAVSDSLAALAPSVLWAGIIVARFTASRVANAKNTVRLILWGSVIGGAALTAAALLNLPVPAYLGLFAAGVFGGAVIPLSIARLCALYPAVSGRVTSIIFLTLVSPSLILPSLTGSMADAVGFRWVMVLSGVFLLISAVFAGLTRDSGKA